MVRRSSLRRVLFFMHQDRRKLLLAIVWFSLLSDIVGKFWILPTLFSTSVYISMDVGFFRALFLPSDNWLSVFVSSISSFLTSMYFRSRAIHCYSGKYRSAVFIFPFVFMLDSRVIGFAVLWTVFRLSLLYMLRLKCEFRLMLAWANHFGSN